MTAISSGSTASLSAQRVEKTQAATEKDDLNEKRARQVLDRERGQDKVTSKDLKETQVTKDLERSDLRKERVADDLSESDVRKGQIASDIETSDRQEAQTIKRLETNDEFNARLKISFSEEGEALQSSIQEERPISEARGNVLDTEA